MIRTMFKGVLLLGVVGVGYWYWADGGKEEPSASLIHTPQPSFNQKGSGSRVAMAKATNRKIATREAARRPGKKEPGSKAPKAVAPVTRGAKEKSSSNQPFAELKASSLNKAKSVALTKQKAKVAKGAKVVTKQTLATVASSPNKAVATAKMARVEDTTVEGFSLPRVALSYEVENREPTQVSERFSNGTRVHLFMEARNKSKEALTLIVRWHDPTLAHPISVPLKVPANVGRYRTWANSSPIKGPGTHQVSVQIKDGPEIFRRQFEVLAAKLPATQNLNDRAAR